MKVGDSTIRAAWRSRPAAWLGAGALCVASLTGAATLTFGSAAASEARATPANFPCSGPNGSKIPCHFSTPSGNIRCLWTPSPSNIACETVVSGRAYRLRPAGHAKAIKLKLARRGQALPRGQQIVFPQSLSCRDTRTTMTCNQDFGTGAFRLAPKGSHSS